MFTKLLIVLIAVIYCRTQDLSKPNDFVADLQSDDPSDHIEETECLSEDPSDCDIFLDSSNFRNSSVEQEHSPFNGMAAVFVHLGQWTITVGNRQIRKNYFLSRRFRSTWTHTRSICKAYNMDVVSLDTGNEHNHFLELCQARRQFFETYTHIGAMTSRGGSPQDWYWINSGRRLTYNLRWANGEPNNHRNSEFCLALDIRRGNFQFNDVWCHTHHDTTFVCQSVT